MNNSRTRKNIENEPVPGIKSAGPCANIATDGKKPPYWLAIRDPNAKLSDRICDFLLFDSQKPYKHDCLEVYAKGLISPSELTQNKDGSWSCTCEKTLMQLNGVYVAIHDEKTGKRLNRCWVQKKDTFKNRTLASLAMEIREASRRRYYPKYLYLLSVTNDVTGRKISDFTLYTKHSIPDIGLEVIRLNQAEIPAIYKQPDGTYRCTDEELRFGDEGLTFQATEKKSPWHKSDEHPSHELCEAHRNKFISWDGNDTYLVTFDEYDKLFRKPADIGGIRRNVPDDTMVAWACLPTTPSRDWIKTNQTEDIS